MTASFELERLELEGDRLVVSGNWFGVRGIRFVRPTLMVGGRQVLATLEHKPWAPSEDDPWTAEFPWKDGAVDVNEAALCVAPSVIVPLAARTDDYEDATTVAEANERAYTLRVLTADRDRLAADRDRLAAERDRLAAERDRLAAERDEAVKDRKAALRTRKRMEGQRDKERVELAAIEAERDQTRAERDGARSQRDEALLAHRALQHQLDSERAQAQRTRSGEPELPAEKPIGVRTIPAAASVAPDLLRELPAPSSHISTFDLWAIRAFGSIAAVCFITLLVMLLRLFF